MSKSLFVLIALLVQGFTRSIAAEPAPDAREVLKSVRVAHSNQDWKFTGVLKTKGVKVRFNLAVTKGIVRYEFPDNGDVLTLRLGDKDSRLEEIKGGRAESVGPAKFDEKVRGTDITYEDLAMKFLYWPNAKVVGDDAIMATSCWKLTVLPPNSKESSFSQVNVWIAKDSGGLMKAESFDHSGRLVRRFIVRSVMKREGAWFLKVMRIETIPPGKESDTSPTFLELEDVQR